MAYHLADKIAGQGQQIKYVSLREVSAVAQTPKVMRIAKDKGITRGKAARGSDLRPQTFIRAVYGAALGHVGPAVLAWEVSLSTPILNCQRP